MNQRNDPLENARITGSTIQLIEANGREMPVEVYTVRTSHGTFFFECKFRFSDNGNDFWASISNFVLKSKSNAGATSLDVRWKFSLAQAAQARSLLTEFFFGDTGKSLFPRNINNSRCLGVEYMEDWIVLSAEPTK